MEDVKKDYTVLVVEDERPLAEAISKKLQKSGFTALSSRTVEQALQYMDDPDVGRIDAIWLDHYLLGEKTGLDFLASCRESGGKCKETPIFVVTNTAGEEKTQTYLELGATKYYIKSNNRLEDIINDIRGILESK